MGIDLSYKLFDWMISWNPKLLFLLWITNRDIGLFLAMPLSVSDSIYERYSEQGPCTCYVVFVIMQLLHLQVVGRRNRKEGSLNALSIYYQNHKLQIFSRCRNMYRYHKGQCSSDLLSCAKIYPQELYFSTQMWSASAGFFTKKKNLIHRTMWHIKHILSIFINLLCFNLEFDSAVPTCSDSIFFISVPHAESMFGFSGKCHVKAPKLYKIIALLCDHLLVSWNLLFFNPNLYPSNPCFDVYFPFWVVLFYIDIWERD